MEAQPQKLTDIGNGMDRPRRVADAVGEARYSPICRELSLPGVSIDDIPDRAALQRLLSLFEAEAARGNRLSPLPVLVDLIEDP